MFSRISNIFIGCIMLMALGGVLQVTNKAIAEDKCKPVNGHFCSQVVDCTSPGALLCTEGRLIGGIQGDYEATITSFIPSGDPTIPAVQFYIGKSVTHTKNGDLYATDAGAFDFSNGDFAALLTITGGTGCFEGASGHLYVFGNSDFATGITTGDYKGEISTEAKCKSKVKSKSTVKCKFKAKGKPKTKCKPVNGHIDSQVVPVPPCTSPFGLCTEGTMTGGIQGDFDFTATNLIPSGEPTIPWVAFYTGQFILQTKDGDLLFGTDSGAFDTDPAGNGNLAELFTITGGTGDLEGASGRLVIFGTFNLATGIGDSDYKGEICTASPAPPVPQKHNTLSTTWGKIKTKY